MNDVRALDEPGWWYVRLYPGGLDQLDRAVVDVLRPLVTWAVEQGADRWFHIQYTDWRGPHLRLRIHGPRVLLDALHQRLPELAAQCAALGRERAEQRFSLFDLDFRPFGGRYAGADVAVYEPEYGKYGGPDGTRLAEAVFQESSDLALWAADFRRSPDRAALATLLMEAAVRSLDHLGEAAADVPLDAAHFWARHLHWWTRDAGPEAGELQSRLRDEAALDRWGIGPRAAELAADTSVTAQLASWTATLTAHLREAAAAGIPRTTGHLLFHQVHMMTNRLGVLPREEALLGVIAAQGLSDPLTVNRALLATR
ncbi:thiopeptide-type bacteriocin biosynthesis protein [Streptomyces sp. ISL-43]|uniref:thiopeptide-type bacteriocin biosynthesis protein n=1 Tax=Streptomyces sp. ISL-43 TaxID=2819183 RepID=UPI001BE72649|nr:thiopeptide-type bacteriocin biosynthesis protein [Streptomyces sp. ISL-43]MBT2445590.1 thiopeptide-type bacteriocin biosynthesis protein [Streptomyces sp. ISL-43]